MYMDLAILLLRADRLPPLLFRHAQGSQGVGGASIGELLVALLYNCLLRGVSDVVYPPPG